MNLTLDGDQPHKAVQYLTFNQDFTSIQIGTKLGYSIYSLENIDQIQRIFHSEDHTDVSCIERLNSSSLVVLVSLLSPRKLRTFHIKQKAEIQTLSYQNTILSAKLNRKRLVICLEDQILIHSLDGDLNLKWIIRNIPTNSLGLFALSPCDNPSYLAYPVNQSGGGVQIFDTVELQNKLLIPAHENRLASLAFNQQSSMLASASEKGTVIRVHSVDDGQCLYEFRRGYARCVDIYSLSFSLDSLFLAASSSTETVHIFKLDQTKDEQSALLPNQASWSSYLGRALLQSSTYISTHVSDMLHQWRSFATCRLPFKQLKNVCAITTIDKQLRVLVVSSEGYLYIYHLDVNEGGDCVLVKQHCLEESESSAFHRDSSNHGAQQVAFSSQQPETYHHHHLPDGGSGGGSSSSNPEAYDNDFPFMNQQVSKGSFSRS